MVQKKTLYGIMAIMVALLVISSSLTLYYYYEYQQTSLNNNKTVSELQSATSKYSSLASNYNTILSTYNGSISSFEQLASAYNLTSANFLSVSKEFNVTFSLLANAVSELNTSEPAYVNASKMLSQLWIEYLTIANQYKELTSNFETILASFEGTNNVTLSEKIQPVSVSLLTSDILIDFGNGTYDWFNNTSVQPGWNFYVATLVVTGGNVNATWYPQYSEHFITGIDGVLNNNAQNEYWFLWTYNATSSWQVAQVGADQLMMYNGSVYAWTYCAENTATYAPECTP